MRMQMVIRRLPKPVIAMVAGYAVGGGHVLHMVCDLTVGGARGGSRGREGQILCYIARILRSTEPIRLMVCDLTVGAGSVLLPFFLFTL